MTDVVTCDHIECVKTKRIFKYPAATGTEPEVLRDVPMVTLPARTEQRDEEVVSVRMAKATLSALLDKVVAGRQVLITSDGRPKARLVPVEPARARKMFTGSARHLAAMPAWRGGPDSTELISADRDERVG